jgi:hypothetical protein
MVLTVQFRYVGENTIFGLGKNLHSTVCCTILAIFPQTKTAATCDLKKLQFTVWKLAQPLHSWHYLRIRNRIGAIGICFCIRLK